MQRGSRGFESPWLHQPPNAAAAAFNSAGLRPPAANFGRMKLFTLFLSAMAAVSFAACSLETEGPGFENEAPEDFAGFQWRGDGDFTETVSLPQGVLAWCHRAIGDSPITINWSEVTGEFAQTPIPVDHPGTGEISGYEAIEVTSAGKFALEIVTEGSAWDAAVSLPSNTCPWDG